jgi:hypothetical protein
VKIFTQLLCNMGTIDTEKLSRDSVGGLLVGIPAKVGRTPNWKKALLLISTFKVMGVCHEL